MPTTGRSVLLLQLAKSLAADGSPALTSWNVEQSIELLHYLRMAPQRGVTVLVDDLDLAGSPDLLCNELLQLLRRDPSARVITVSINPALPR